MSDHPTTTPAAQSRASRRLARALLALRPRPGDAPSLQRMSPADFRATVAHRLASLERELGEVRARINGLLFVVAGAVITQLVLRLIG
jgi:hypothetical protein